MQEVKKERLRNRLHDVKYLEEYNKGFDIITLNPINQKKIEELINKKPMYTTWDRLVISSHRPGIIKIYKFQLALCKIKNQIY